MNIDELRNKIADIDDELLVLYEKRLVLVRQVGEYKKANGMPVKNAEVEKEKLEKLLSGCSPDDRKYIGEIFQGIFDVSCNVQKDMTDDKRIN